MKNNSSEKLEAFLDHLDDEHRALLEESPRQNRLGLLAQLRRESEQETIEKLGQVTGLEVREDFELMPHATDHLSLRVIQDYQCVPVVEEEEYKEDGTADNGAQTSNGNGRSNGKGPRRRRRHRKLSLVTLWPPEPGMDEWIFAVSGMKPRWILSPAKNIVNCITQNFGVGAANLDETDFDEGSGGRQSDEEEDEDAAIIRFVNEVIEKAVEDRATDIHFEPLKESLRIRYRIDGELVPIRVPDNLVNYEGAIISRLKIMAKLNIAEKRRPQDGRINYRSGGSDLDVRLSTMPTMYGESISLRLLNQKNQPLSMTDLGMMQEDQNRVKSVLDLPYGIILVTGPTGSGKSTSLTAFIREINTPGRRIITVEDPIEYEVPGINQSQVKHDIGYDFAGALRHILRQDPDVIMIGEIRDQETADIAIRAALTGHLVFSTLHTNDAPGALTRLVDMDIEPFLIASSVELVIAQRLVRRLCPQCRSEVNPPDQHFLEGALTALRIPLTPENLATPYYQSEGCEYCRKLGFRGRVGLFETLRMNDLIHDMIVKRESAGAIRREAMGHGLVTLQQSAWQQVRRGLTTFSEVMRYSKLEEEEEETPLPGEKKEVASAVVGEAAD